MVYLYDCEEFISDFEPEALRKFAESEDMKQEKKFVRLRTDTNKKALTDNNLIFILFSTSKIKILVGSLKISELPGS